MKILVVDDEKMTLLALSRMLKDKNYEVVTTSNGIEALKIVADENIDLIISDVMMPCVSGFTLLTMLKNFYFSKIPLILMSGYPIDDMVLKTHGLDESNFVRKPVDFDELVGKIEHSVN